MASNFPMGGRDPYNSATTYTPHVMLTEWRSAVRRFCGDVFEKFIFMRGKNRVRGTYRNKPVRK